MDPTHSQCGVQPSVWFLLGTLILTCVATAMLCGAIMTDHWEHVTWDHDKLEEVVSKANGNSSQNQLRHQLEWLFDRNVAKIVAESAKEDEEDRKQTRFSTTTMLATTEPEPAVFLVPMHGGIWTLCVSLSDDQRHFLEKSGYKSSPCINYLSPDITRGEDGRVDWQHRMQNLSISCALVCLIILGCSALVGIFGVVKHQISAVLVTGVMYLLAATFAIFSLTIIHFKRQQVGSRWDCTGVGRGVPSSYVDGVSSTSKSFQLDQEYFDARIFSTSWSLDLGWGGVTFCIMASILWIFLSKIMRYNPLSTILT